MFSFRVRIKTVKRLSCCCWSLQTVNISRYRCSRPIIICSIWHGPDCYLDCACVHLESSEYKKLIRWPACFNKSKPFRRFQFNPYVKSFTLFAHSLAAPGSARSSQSSVTICVEVIMFCPCPPGSPFSSTCQHGGLVRVDWRLQKVSEVRHRWTSLGL